MWVGREEAEQEIRDSYVRYDAASH
jgi:hypothetical protein